MDYNKDIPYRITALPMSKTLGVIVGIIVLAALAYAAFYFFPNTSSAPVVEEQQPTTSQGKLNIYEVCTSALAYMSFPDGESADAFVAACVEGKHPEVIERYKSDHGYGDGAAI